MDMGLPYYLPSPHQSVTLFILALLLLSHTPPLSYHSTPIKHPQSFLAKNKVQSKKISKQSNHLPKPIKNILFFKDNKKIDFKFE